MKTTLRKELRVRRRALRASDHRHRSLAAAEAVMRLRSFPAGKRIALYLPFDAESDTAALIATAWRRGVQVFVPVISDPRHRRLRSSSSPWLASTAPAGGWAWGAATMIEPWRSAVAGAAGGARIWSGSPLTAGAPM